MKKAKTYAELKPTMTEQEWRKFFAEKDAIQSREVTAKELGTSKYTLRRIAVEDLGIIYKQGRRKQTVQFKKEN